MCWGIVRVILTSAGQYAFTWQAFMAGAFLNAIPGIVLQIVIVPVIVLAVEKQQRTENTVFKQECL